MAIGVEGGIVNLILTLHGDEQRVLANWNNVCYVESRGSDGENLHARVHFNGSGGVAAMSVAVMEDIDEIASLLEAADEVVVEVGEDGDDEGDKGADKG
jgi:hypothetical protein